MKATFIAIFVLQSASAANAIQSVNVKGAIREQRQDADAKVEMSFGAGGGLQTAKGDHAEATAQNATTGKISFSTLKRAAALLAEEGSTDEEDAFSLQELEAMTMSKSLNKKTWTANANEGALQSTCKHRHSTTCKPRCLRVSTAENGAMEDNELLLVKCDKHTLFSEEDTTFKKTSHQLKLKFRGLCLEGELNPELLSVGRVYARTCAMGESNPRYQYQKWQVDHHNHQVKLDGTNYCATAKESESTVVLSLCVPHHADQTFQMRKFDKIDSTARLT